jgi:hypothetical protein
MKVFAFTLARHTHKTGLITIARTPHATAIIDTQMSIGGSGGSDPTIGTTTIRITIESIGTTIGIDEPSAQPAVRFFCPITVVGKTA